MWYQHEFFTINKHNLFATKRLHLPIRVIHHYETSALSAFNMLGVNLRAANGNLFALTVVNEGCTFLSAHDSVRARGKFFCLFYNQGSLADCALNSIQEQRRHREFVGGFTTFVNLFLHTKSVISATDKIKLPYFVDP